MEGKPYDTSMLPEDMVEFARYEVNEKPVTRKAHLNTYKRWLPKQTHIVAKPTEEMVVKFLRRVRFELQPSKDMFENYYILRSRIPEWFENLDVNVLPGVKYLFQNGWFLPLGHNDSGERVLFMRFGKYEKQNFSVDDYFKAFFMTLEYILISQKTQICGLAIFTDMSEEDYKYAGDFVVSDEQATKFLHVLEFAMPIRIFFWLIPCKTVLEEFLARVFKLEKAPNVGNKVINILSQEHFDQLLDKNVLPAEYDGTAGTIADLASNYLHDVIKMRSYFQRIETYKSYDRTSLFGAMPDSVIFSAFDD